jgi:drug/metabolite transporter (DMT)-like permease
VIVVLVLLSALLHALWNALLRLERDKDRSLIVAIVVATCIAAAIATMRWALGETLFASMGAVGFAVLAGLFEASYFATLARAMEIGKLGVVYTISRGGAVVAVWPLSIALFSEAATPPAIAGSLVVLAGLALSGLTAGRGGRPGTTTAGAAGTVAVTPTARITAQPTSQAPTVRTTPSPTSQAPTARASAQPTSPAPAAPTAARTAGTEGAAHRRPAGAVGWAIACAVSIAGYHLAYKASLDEGANPSACFALSLGVSAIINGVRLGAAGRRSLGALVRGRGPRLLLMGVVCSGSFLILIEALARGGSGFVLTLRNISVLFAAGMARLIGERPRRAEVVGAVLVAAGATLMAW